MPKESVVEIPSGSGNKYRYVYDHETGRTEYLGPVGSAPDLGEEEFLDAIPSSGKQGTLIVPALIGDGKKVHWVKVDTDEVLCGAHRRKNYVVMPAPIYGYDDEIILDIDAEVTCQPCISVQQRRRYPLPY